MCWPQSNSKTLANGFLNTREICFSTISTSVNNSRTWLSLTFDLLSSVCFLQQEEQVSISAILTWFKQLPWSHSGASRMHHGCTVIPWGSEQLWKGAGKLRAQQKQRYTFFSRRTEGCVKRRSIMVNLILYYNFFTLICNILSSAKELNTQFFCSVLADDIFFIETGHVLLYLL